MVRCGSAFDVLDVVKKVIVSLLHYLIIYCIPHITSPKYHNS